MNSPHIDLLAVLIASVVNMIIGFIWYSRFLFGEKHEPLIMHNKWPILWNFIAVLISAFFLAFFETFLGVTTVTDGMFVGFIVYLGFVATTQISAVIWGKMTMKRFLVHTGCQALSFLAMGGIIGA